MGFQSLRIKGWKKDGDGKRETKCEVKDQKLECKIIQSNAQEEKYRCENEMK